MELFKNSKPEFADERGTITRVLNNASIPIKSILLITSVKGTIRSNHYHKKDSHYCYLISGKIEYTEQPVGKESERKTVILEPGDMVYTPPMAIHAMRFLEQSVLLAFATESREQTDYESDTVRVSFIDEE
jgi:dTDP-4-dehydrorhamnose 3,5-epimerase-like enzyme